MEKLAIITSMNKKKLSTLLIIIATLIVFTFVGYIYARDYTTWLQPSITATIANIDDETHIVTVKNTSGTEYKINVENTADDTITCVNLPDLAKGDTVEFKLPEAHFNAEDYLTCYETSSKKHYYITVK